MLVSKVRILWAFLVPLGGCQVSHAESPVPSWTWDGVERIVAVGDVHGAYDEFSALLRSLELIDADTNWQGGTTHLVSVGDLVDRGAESARAMDLLMALQPQAEAAGGRVHVLMGNHEFMNVTGDLRDVSQAEYDALGGPAGHRAAFASSGRYGAWIRTLPFAIRINDSGFAHGGLSSLVGASSWAELNTTAHAQMHRLLDEGERLIAAGTLPLGVDLIEAAQQWSERAATQDSEAPQPPPDFIAAAREPLFADDGPLWYRGNAACHPILEGPQLTETLANLGIARVVIGHTPTASREITARLDGRVYAIDTGMLAAVYRGEPRALEILYADEGSIITAFDDDGDDAGVRVLPASDPEFTTLAEARAVSDSEDPLELAFETAGDSTTFEFHVMRERQVNNAVAAFRLDRHLGLNMVAAAAPYRYAIAGERQRDGLLLHRPGRYLSERRRQERGYSRPTYCERGSDFYLLAAFDALIGVTTRGLDNLLYDTRTWGIRSVGNEVAFGTSTKLPEYTSQPLLNPALADRMVALSEATLSELLGDYLKPKQIAAILKRRDAILGWPREA